jgi:hypothetical protein
MPDGDGSQKQETSRNNFSFIKQPVDTQRVTSKKEKVKKWNVCTNPNNKRQTTNDKQKQNLKKSSDQNFQLGTPVPQAQPTHQN